jgi:hypothetical protein
VAATSEEAVAGIIDAAVSSFVPDLTAELPSPFAIQANADYSRWLAGIDPGSWWQMMRPGATGFGLMVAFHNMFVCCHGLNGQGASYDDLETPLLFPALVQWTSVIDPVNDRLAYKVAEDYARDLDFPPIGITGFWFPDDGELMPMVNLVHEEDADYEEFLWNHIGDIDQVLLGLAAPWQVLPVTPAAAAVLKDVMPARAELYGTGVLGLTNCQFGDISEDEVGQMYDEWLSVNHGEQDCKFELGWVECACGARPTAVQQFEALTDPLFTGVTTPGELLLPPILSEAWRVAQLQYLTGWLANHARMMLGDAWSTFCWRRLSPFSGSHSLELLHQRLSEPSTSSPTPPGSSVGSSQLSMPFA